MLNNNIDVFIFWLEWSMYTISFTKCFICVYKKSYVGHIFSIKSGEDVFEKRAFWRKVAPI